MELAESLWETPLAADLIGAEAQIRGIVTSDIRPRKLHNAEVSALPLSRCQKFARERAADSLRKRDGESPELR